MGDLSAHFSKSEFACRCCGKVVVSPRLLLALEKLRGIVGKSIHLNCGYRCKKHNAAVGGAKDSQHVKGTAADITIEGLTPLQVKAKAMLVPEFVAGGVGIYDTFTHVDVRKGMARWDERSKK